MFDSIFNFVNSETFTKAINSKIVIAVIGIVLTAFVTYFVNKLASLSPKKQEIYNTRLENVLLPLQKHFILTATRLDNQRIHINKINHIYKNHMIYITFCMQELINKLNKHISSSTKDDTKKTQKLILAIKLQTAYEYEFVRSKLRLPSKRFRVNDFLIASILRNTYSLDTFIDYLMNLIFTSICLLVGTLALYKYFLYHFPSTTFITMTILGFEFLALFVFSITISITIITKFTFWLYSKCKPYKKSTTYKKLSK